jgi:hypothetical protein
VTITFSNNILHHAVSKQASIYLQGPRNATVNFSQDSWPPVRESKLGIPEYEAGIYPFAERTNTALVRTRAYVSRQDTHPHTAQLHSFRRVYMLSLQSNTQVYGFVRFDQEWRKQRAE